MSERIPHEILAICAMNAALHTDGVSGMAGGLSHSVQKTLLGIERPAKGIRISEDRNGLIVDAYVNVCFEAKIPVVAWEIQENVKEKLDEIADAPVSKVNIHVQGVGHKPEDGAEDEAEDNKEEQVDCESK